MGYSRALSLLLAAALPASATNMRVQSGATRSVGSQGAAGAQSGPSSAAGAGLAAPPLPLGSLSNPLSPIPTITPALGPAPAGVVSAAGQSPVPTAVINEPVGRGGGSPVLTLPQSALNPNAPSPAAMKNEAGQAAAPGTDGKAPVLDNLAQTAGREAKPGSPAKPGQNLDLDEQGRALFDGQQLQGREEAVVPTLGQRFASGLRGLTRLVYTPDKLPKKLEKGSHVRVQGRTYTLDKKLSEENGVARWYSFTGGDAAVLLMSVDAAARFAPERAALEEMAASGIPHAKLQAVSEDGRMAVQDYNSRWEPADKMLAEGRYRPKAQVGWYDMAAALISRGVTADLRLENLSWDSYRTSWLLLNAQGFTRAPPVSVVKQMMRKDFLAVMNSDPLSFLRALRGRLDPDSQSWQDLQSAGRKDAQLAAVFEELDAFDAAREKAPEIKLASSKPTPNNLDDSLSTYSGVRKRLGYDPLKVKTAYQMHGDDPGKLNTQVHELEVAGHPKVVRKIASADIISNELFMRKVVHRWFASHFDTPWSMAVMNGYESMMVMEKASGSGGIARMSKADHAAMGVLMNAFGIYDANKGNILYGGGKPVLIDFEQALGSRHPVSGRLPDQGILWELPWVDRLNDPMTIEDFLPAVRAWRLEFAKPSVQAELRTMLLESGFSKAEAEGALRRIAGNTALLTATLQSDVEFAEGFLR